MTELASPSLEPLRSRFWAEDEPVIRVMDRKTIEGFEIPRFGEDRWDLRCIIASPNVRPCDSVLRFADIADPVQRITAKELIAQRLSNPLPSPRSTGRPERMAAESAVALLKRFRQVCSFLEEKCGKTRFSEVVEADAKALLQDMQARNLAPHTTLTVLVIFDHVRCADPVLSYDRLDFLPWKGRRLIDVVALVRPEENRTPWIPDLVMEKTLFWALLYVDTFAPDILTANERVRDHDRTIADQLPKVRRPGSNLQLDLADYLNVLRAAGRRIPSHYDRAGKLAPSWALVAAEAGIAYNSMGNIRMELRAAAAELGLDQDPLGLTICVPTGAEVTWRRPFDMKEARQEASMLMAACYIVCAYLSGMRDGEVQALRRGCLKIERDAYGEIVRRRVEGRAFKGVGEDLYKECRWVVIEEVGRALERLESLTAFMGDAQDNKLFVHLEGGADPDNKSLKNTINEKLRAFRDHVNETIVPRLASPDFLPIPMDKGRPWAFSTRQFRRTLAWHIGNRPFGTVAGMIQYGHVSEVMFEGYAGRAESGLPGEIEAAKALARTKDVVELYEDSLRGIKPAGPIAAELLADFERLKVDLSPLPGRVIDDKERGRLLQFHAKRLHPGLLADCFFLAADARCLGQDRVGATRPIVGVCDPNCPNACWTKKHLAVWEAHSDDVAKLAKSNHISPLSRDVLKASVERSAMIVTEIRKAAGLPARETRNA